MYVLIWLHKSLPTVRNLLYTTKSMAAVTKKLHCYAEYISVQTFMFLYFKFCFVDVTAAIASDVLSGFSLLLKFKYFNSDISVNNSKFG